MNKKVLLAIIPALFILAGCQSNQAKDQTAITSLKTLEVQKYGISVQYPTNWNAYGQLVDENSNLMGLIISPENEKNLYNKTGVSGFEIVSVNSGDIRKFIDSRMKITKNMNKDVGVEVVEDEVVIDGVSMIREKTKNVKLQATNNTNFETKDYVIGNGAVYFFEHNNKIIMMSFRYPASDEEKYKNILEQIALSLKFLKK